MTTAGKGYDLTEVVLVPIIYHNDGVALRAEPHVSAYRNEVPAGEAYDGKPVVVTGYPFEHHDINLAGPSACRRLPGGVSTACGSSAAEAH
jgi:hypothetical protein